MKTLLILRHGKAEEYNSDGDRCRALTHRGIRDAEQMGKFLAKRCAQVDLVIASNAERAAQTAHIVFEKLNCSSKIDWRPEIYEASIDALFEVVKELSHTVDTALIVGHNPGLELLVSFLTHEPYERCRLPTAGAAQIEIGKQWSDAAEGKGVLTGYWSPN